MMRVPQQHVAGMSAIARFSDDDLAQILPALADPELHNVEQTVEALAKRLTFPPDEMQRAIEATMSLANARADLGNSIPDFIEDLIHSMEEDDRKELHLPTDQLAQLKKNLTGLLADANLVIASKVIFLSRDYEHQYCRARILTDIRPIFGEDRTLPPTAALIVHMLQLIYHEGRSTKEIHIALDDEDLASLKLQIERAGDKAKSLKTLLNSAKVVIASD
jgi:hypothetical protein